MGFNKVYSRTETGHGRMVQRMVKRKALTIGMLVLFCFGNMGCIKVPAFWFYSCRRPEYDIRKRYHTPGSTVERTEEVLDAVQKAMR